MKLKALLSEIRELGDRLHQDYGLLKFYRRQSYAISSPRYGEKIHTEPSGKAPFEKWVLKELDKEREIKEEEDRLSELKLRATNALEKLENKDMALAIMYRHISLMTYDEIMSAMSLSRSSLYRLLNEAEPVIESLEV